MRLARSLTRRRAMWLRLEKSKPPISNSPNWCPRMSILATIPPEAILGVVTPMVEGEILIREGKLDEGFKELHAAVRAGRYSKVR